MSNSQIPICGERAIMAVNIDNDEDNKNISLVLIYCTYNSVNVRNYIK